MLREHPILFSTPMVKAILSGNKVMTRRVVKLRDGDDPYLSGGRLIHPMSGLISCPYGEAGDLLWCREGFWTNGAKPSEADFVIYHLEHESGLREVSKDRQGNFQEGAFIGQYKRFPSIFLPRWASRIILEITSIKVERLWDISEEDIKAEGFNYLAYRCADEMKPEDWSEFSDGWDMINGKRKGCSWADNPWCWCISFRRIKP
jgi:hypothetical protein